MNTTIAATGPDFGLREAVHSEVHAWGAVRIVPLRPEEDIELVHGWVREERARFWGMLDHSREQVLEIYQFLDSLDTHHAFLALLDEQPVALFQTYEPLHDPVSEAYPARAEDAGMHLLLAPPTQPVPHFTPRLVSVLLRYMFADPAIDRVIVEPDARNDKAIRRLRTTCFELGPKIQLAEKEAQLAFLTRDRFENAPTV